MGNKLDCLGCIKELNSCAGKNIVQNDEITEFQVGLSIGEEEFEHTTKEAFSFFEFHESLKRTESKRLVSVKMIKFSQNTRKKQRCSSLKQPQLRIYSSNQSINSINICHYYKKFNRHNPNYFL